MKALQAGVKEEHLQMAAQLRREGVSQEEAAQKVMEAGASPAIMPALAGMFGFVQFHDEKDLPQLLQELKKFYHTVLNVTANSTTWMKPAMKQVFHIIISFLF